VKVTTRRAWERMDFLGSPTLNRCTWRKRILEERSRRVKPIGRRCGPGSLWRVCGVNCRSEPNSTGPCLPVPNSGRFQRSQRTICAAMCSACVADALTLGPRQASWIDCHQLTRRVGAASNAQDVGVLKPKRGLISVPTALLGRMAAPLDWPEDNWRWWRISPLPSRRIAEAGHDEYGRVRRGGGSDFCVWQPYSPSYSLGCGTWGTVRSLKVVDSGDDHAWWQQATWQIGTRGGDRHVPSTS